MPGFDRTGPLGEGPMTGGGFGYCGSGRSTGYLPRRRTFYGRFGAGRGPGFGRGRVFGRGYSIGYAYWRPMALDQKAELAELQREANDLKAYLKDLEARIAELEKPSE
ncbi:MAG: DUF5320 domain-containing protein [Deltaproteobacteria bacterium]|nr:DUF5320 domain-containing protein [Deltaproteobacteria bacterium]